MVMTVKKSQTINFWLSGFVIHENKELKGFKSRIDY
jgi:hypothetical protein